MSSPLISVIIPIYNVEAYLRECLNSIISQTYQDWECILVDDASTDGSARIAEEFCNADSRFRLIRHAENRGQSDARNTGLDVASGERIMFVDSDDVIHPSIIMSGITEDADIVCFDLNYSQRHFMKLCEEKNPKCESTTYNSKDALIQLLYQTGRLNSSPCGKIFKSEVFEGNRFISGLTYEDLELICRLFKNSKTIVDNPLKLYFYRQRSGSYTHQWSSKRLDVLTVTECIENNLGYDDELLRAARDRRFAANFNMLLLMRKNGLGNTEEARECRAQLRRLCGEVMRNPHARLKNRIGAVLARLLYGLN